MFFVQYTISIHEFFKINVDEFSPNIGYNDLVQLNVQFFYDQIP